METSKLFEYNKKDVSDFVESLKKETLLKGYDINESNANLYKQMLDSIKHCAICKSLNECTNSVKGYTKFVKNNSIRMCPCKYLKQSEKEEEEISKLQTLFISTETLDASFSNVDLNTEAKKRAYKECVNFVTNINDKKSGIYLYGAFGVGKTYLLASLAKELIKKDKTVLFVYFPDLVRYMNGIMYENSKLEQLIEKIKECDVLILDDLGAEYLSSWFRDQVLGPILNYRYLSKKPICVSSNLTPKEMLEHFSSVSNDNDKVKGGRITKRLFELANNVVNL